jgi:hypothetical protein
MRTIGLTRGKVALVDDEDYERLDQYNWQAVQGPSGNWYARGRRSSAEQASGHGYFRWMHQEVLGCGRGVDHIDGDGLNNQRSNLRVADQSVNNQNKRKKAGTSSQYLGVSWWEPSGKWKAQVKIPKGKVTYLGLFSEEVEAALAYDTAVRKLYTGYVKTNFPAQQIGGSP